MKPLIVYQSRTGNTKIIAETISSVLNADILTVDDVTSTDLKNRNLVGFGSGIYWAMIDKKIYDVASFLPKKCNTFVFITSGMGIAFMRRLYWYYTNKGFGEYGVQLAGQWDCRGFDKHPISKWMGISKNHPNNDDIENAKSFAFTMKKYK
jgi:flavodoxin